MKVIEIRQEGRWRGTEEERLGLGGGDWAERLGCGLPAGPGQLRTCGYHLPAGAMALGPACPLLHHAGFWGDGK